MTPLKIEYYYAIFKIQWPHDIPAKYQDDRTQPEYIYSNFVLLRNI